MSLFHRKAKLQDTVELVTHRLAWTVARFVRNEVRAYHAHGETAFMGEEMDRRVNDFEDELNDIAHGAVPSIFVK